MIFVNLLISSLWFHYEIQSLKNKWSQLRINVKHHCLCRQMDPLLLWMILVDKFDIHC